MNVTMEIIAAIVLALLIVGSVFLAVQGGLSEGGVGVNNLTERAKDDGEPDFTSSTPEQPKPVKPVNYRVQEVKALT
ncbi:MAG: hypothetical protein ABEJ93_01755 [Candidatus Nanohalobium sp.]